MNPRIHFAVKSSDMVETFYFLYILDSEQTRTLNTNVLLFSSSEGSCAYSIIVSHLFEILYYTKLSEGSCGRGRTSRVLHARENVSEPFVPQVVT